MEKKKTTRKAASTKKKTASKKEAKVKVTARAVDFRGLFQKKVFFLLALWVGVMISSLGVVKSTHLTRESVQDLEMARKYTEHLKVESGQLLLEKSSLTAYSRIELVATKNLHMYTPPVSEIVSVKSGLFEKN